MAMTDRLREYLQRLAAQHPNDGYIPRVFRTAEEWDKWSSNDWRGHRFGREPGLSSLLEYRRLIVLGEPGSGKSTLASAAIRSAIERGWVPVLVRLREYRGDLPELVARSIPAGVLADALADPSFPILYILDGFDELAEEFIERLLEDLLALEREQNDARVFLTSRQAFFVNRRQLFHDPIPAFYLLEFDSDDIDTFIEKRSTRRLEFLEAAAAAQLSHELANPFALGALLALFEAKNALGNTRSEAVEHVINQTLASRPTSDPKRELQALRMLALTMEIAARNELLDAEAVSVLKVAFRLDDAAAKRLLDELTQSILIRTQNGYAFQMRSYGEYLAAAELADVRERDRLLEPIFLDDTREPHDSWRNSVSYLVELNRGARAYFTTHHPDWLVTSSPNIFSDDLRTGLVRRVVQRLKDRREYLSHHPLIRAFNLGRFVTPVVAEELKAALQSPDDIEVANAILLLGAAGVREVSTQALELALDPNRSLHVRHSALNALDRIGTPDMIPRLLTIPDFDEPSVISRIDTASALMDIRHTGLVLEYLTKTDTTMSAAYYRFRQLATAEEFEAVLDGLLKLDPALLTRRLSMYIEQMWPSMMRAWDPRWVPKLTELLLRTEDHEHDFADKLAEELLKLDDHGAAIGRHIVVELVRQGRELRGFPRTVPQLVTVADAEWLEAQPESEELVRHFRAFGSAEVRQFLFRNVPTQPADARLTARHNEWERRRKAEEDRTSALLEVLRHSNDPGELLNAVFRLDLEKWPDLREGQREALATAVDKKLRALDLPNRIVWTSENSWTMPQALPVLLKVIDRYELRLTDDRLLVQALGAQEDDSLERYRQRFGLSAEALADIETMLTDAALPAGALDGVVDFVVKARLRTPAVVAAFDSILLGGRSDRTKLSVVSGLGQSADGTAALEERLNRLTGDIRRAAENELLRSQHLPTILRRLAQLEGDPSLLASGNVERHFNHPLDWIGHIRHHDAWKSLKKLRRLALQSSLDHVVRIITGTMASMDKLQLSKVMLEQIQDAPAAWQPYQRTLALEHERDGKILAAQSAPFDRVLQRLKAFSTLSRFKLWVEGPKDRPPLEVLTARAIGDAADVVTQSFGGWAQVLSDNWSPRGMGDGCSDFMVLFDGDRARDFSKPGFPVRPDREIREAMKKLDRHGIEYQILERYAIENYFPQAAYERVMGPGVTQYFPLDPARSVESQIPGYNKNMNGALAEATDLAEIGPTDLGRILADIRRRVTE
jgi:hypothetical protein